MYTRLTEMAKDIRPLRFGWLSIINRYRNTRILSNMREYFTEWCEMKNANEFTYEHLISFMHFIDVSRLTLPPTASGIFIHYASEDTSKTSYKYDSNTFIMNIHNSVTPLDELSIYLNTNNGVAEIKYVSRDIKDVFILSRAKGAISIDDKGITHTRIFALQEVRYAMITYVQQYLAKLYELYT